MPQFDVHLNPSPESRTDVPYLVDIQSDLLDRLSTRVVVPLVRSKSFGKPLTRLNFEIVVKGQTLIFSTAELSGVPRTALGSVVANIRTHRDQAVAALDLLITGI